MPTSSAKRNNTNPKSDDASKLIRENMKCPVCLEVLLPPIYQCETGHNICYLCVDEVSECPLCKSDYGDTRNYFAEELVNSMTFPCKYEEYGCKKTFLGSQLKEHQENCECQPYRCPELACQEVVGIHQMGKHLDKHGFKVMKGDVHQASLEILDDHFDRKTEYNPWRISAFKAEFYTVSTRSRDGLWYFWTYGLGLQKDLRKFSYEIVLFSDDKQFMYRGVVQSLRTAPEDIMKGGSCLITSDNVIKSIRKNGRIKCQVYVIQGKSWDAARRADNPPPPVIKGKGKHNTIGRGSLNTTIHKGKRLIPNSVTYTSSTTTHALLNQAKASKSRSILNQLIKGSHLDINKNKESNSGCNNCNARSSSATNKLPVVRSSSSRTKQTTRSRSRSGSLVSVRNPSNVTEAEFDFVEKVRETLRCPGCNDVITPPVLQCMIGHNVCLKCRNSRSDCPLCRAPLGDCRNFFAEELLYKTFQRCVYAKHGCKVCLPSAQMRSHEAVCDFAPFECPFNVCRALLSADDMFDHLQTHLIAVVEKELKAEVDVPRQTPTVPVCTIPNIVKIEKIPFYPIIVRDTDGNWVFYVITHKNLGYRYELQIRKQHKTLAFQGPVLSLRVNHTQVKQKGLSLVMNEKSIKYFKSNDKISYQIKISKVDAQDPSYKGLFQAPVSWVMTPRCGEVLSKAELFANKKTSVSPEEESDEDDDTRSIPQTTHTNTDTVYCSETDEVESIETVNEFSSRCTSLHSVVSESDSHASMNSELSKSKRKKKKAGPGIPAAPDTPEKTPEGLRQTKSSEGRNGLSAEMPSTSASASLKVQKSSTFIKSQSTDVNNNKETKLTLNHEAKMTLRVEKSSSDAKNSSNDSDSVDANNNIKQTPIPGKGAKYTWKKKSNEELPDAQTERCLAKREKSQPPSKVETGNNIYLNPSPRTDQQCFQKTDKNSLPRAEQNNEMALNQNPDKILKQGKRCRSASGHRVRMSEEVICCGGSGGNSDSSSSASGVVNKCRGGPGGHSSKSQVNLHCSYSANRVDALPVASSKHVIALDVQEENETRILSPQREEEEKEFGQLKQAIEAGDNVANDLFEDNDIITAKSINEISDCVINGSFNMVNSVISLFTSSNDPDDSRDNLNE